MGTPGTDAHPHGDLHNPDVAHETSDISIRGVVWFVIVLAGTAALIHVAMWGLFRVFDHMEAANDPFVSPLALPAGTVPPEPRLQTTPWQDLQQLRAAEDATLQSYGWVDQRAGIVRLPIDKAKTLLLERGIPVRTGAPNDPREGTHVASSGESNSAREIPAGQADASTPPPAVATPPAKPGGGA